MVFFGIDVSKYQGEIDWSQVGTHHPIEFVFTRATMGSNGKDAFFT
ncbi:MAG: GH25 family lysozyme, partial [Bacteroidota bacterium]|nr:GH25 family lysozyme [Bacteroidota bacterium]